MGPSKKLALLTGTLATLIMASHAYAGSHSTYVAGYIGLDNQADQDIRGANAAGAPRNIDIELDSGTFYGAAIGVASEPKSWGRWRAEVELGYRDAKLESLALNNVDRRFNPASQEKLTTGFINAFYDTPLYADRFRMFAGAGFGIANIDHEVRYLVERPVAAGGNLAIAIPSTETSWAYQLIGGTEVKLNNKFSVTADVRFVDVGDVQVERFVLTNGNLDSVLDADKSTTSYTVGMRYNF